MLSRFSNEVLSRGAQAVLPQNLNGFWLQRLQKLSDDFLDHNFAVDRCLETPDTDDPLLLSCVHEVLRYNQEDVSKRSDEQLAEDVTIYALSITMETIRRESEIEMALPALEELLSLDRIVRFGKTNPNFSRFLEQSCIVREDASSAEETWFQRLKRRIRERISED